MSEAAILRTTLSLLGGVFSQTASYASGVDLDLLKKGVVLPKNASDDLRQVASEYAVNSVGANSVFYRKITEVQGTPDELRRAHQLLHYLSTYGGIKWLQNDGSVFSLNPITEDEAKEMEKIIPPTMKVIQIFTREELTEKVETCLSGTALNTSTVTGLIEVIKFYNLAIDLDKVKNKEAYAQLALALGVAPKNVSELVRCAVFTTTGSTLIVKNSSLYDGVKYADVTKDQAEMLSNLVVSFVNKHGIDVLARGSNQYRKLLILLRHHLNTDAKRLLNKAMKRAKVTGSGFTQPIVNSMFDKSVEISDKVAAVENLTTAQIIRILEADRLRHSLTEGNVGYTQYRVRNSKLFIKEIGTNGLIALDTKVQEALYSELVERFRHHYEGIGDTVFIPEQVDYAIPSSLKNMVGSFPEFTKFSSSHSSGKTTVGVYWDWNADIDLHAKDVMGRSVGWNSSYNDGGVTYSGDMTSLNNYGWAAEYFALSGDASGVFIDVQMYSSREGKSGQSARVILSTANLRDDFADLSKALVQFPLTYTGERNMGSLFVSSTDNGHDIYLIGNTASMSGRVPNSDLQEARAKIYQAAIKSKIYLREILEAAGINVVTEMADGAVDLSPETFSADKVIVPLSHSGI